MQRPTQTVRYLSKIFRRFSQLPLLFLVFLRIVVYARVESADLGTTRAVELLISLSVQAPWLIASLSLFASPLNGSSPLNAS